MDPLLPPDSFYVQAEEGWLELGNLDDATQELGRVRPDLQTHPDVLGVLWQIHAAALRWEAALEAAAALIQAEPDDGRGWVHRSYALHELKRTAEARDNLLRVVDRFPDSPTLRYNLACYECQLGRLEQAKDWLERAFAMGDARQMRLAALHDPDLEPLWKEIGKSDPRQGT